MYGLENLKDQKAFVDYSNNMQDANKNIEEYNSSRKCNVLIAFSSNKRCYTKLYPFFIIKISNKREVK